MSNINVVQSFWNFAQSNKLKKSSQNLKSSSKNKNLAQQCNFQKVWKIALLQKLELRVLSLHEIMKKNNAWNIRHLVNESFVPSVQWASVLYWRLSDFRTNSVNLVVGVLFGRYMFMAGNSLVLKCNK